MNRALPIISKYCGDVEERIKACRSRAVAEHLKNHLCDELKANCKSEIIHNFLKHYANDLILKYFDKSGRNKLIHE